MINTLHLHMFDGGSAAAGSGASAGASGASGSTGAEGSNASQVVYGKEEQSASNNDIASHGSGEAGQPGVETRDLSAEFDSLIKGDYREQYQQRMNEAIQNRFKNAADYQGQVNQYQDMLAPIAQMYNLKVDDIEGLKNALTNDDGLIAHKANELGMTTEKFWKQLQLEMDAAKGREIQQAIRDEEIKRETYARWDQEAAQLQQAFPSFDLASEIDNTPGFGAYLDNGLSVEDAFFLAHKADILAGSSAQTAQQAQAQTIENFKSRQARPVENGLGSNPAIVRKADPSKFSREDVLEVARRARKGEKISF